MSPFLSMLSRRRFPAIMVTVPVLLLMLSTPAWCQLKVQKWDVKDIQVGFRSYDPTLGGHFKPGLWTPVYIKLKKSPEGRYLFKVQKDDTVRGHLTVGVNDGDGIQGKYHVRFDMGKAEQGTVIGYANPASAFPEFQMILDTEYSKYTLPARTADALSLGHHLYLTIGNRVSGLRKALVQLSPNPNDNSTAPRHAAYETDPARLPAEWFGYQPVDLMILLTSDQKFVESLAHDDARIAAVANWVRGGGHLVVSISWRNPQEVAAIFNSPKWQPALPKVFDQESVGMTSLATMTNYAGDFNNLFPASREDPVQIAKLRPDKAAEVILQEDTGEIVMVRYPYGRGNITLAAVELDRPPFTSWKARDKFWKKLIHQEAPKVHNVARQQQFGGMMGEEIPGQDVTTRLHYQLDNFNVPQISFGWVALFILLFILIVGPLDYLILKVVFKRLEWTWITFPAVVIIITVVSYFTAYALKGDDQKINKVDLVDIDLRTALDKDYQTKAAYGYGRSWFAILSPRIQDYTISMQPAMDSWTKQQGENLPLNDVMVTWLGRPEDTGPGGIGRQNSTSLFRRTYDYAPDATALKSVPIPVWTTKAFTGTYAVKFSGMPVKADLTYDPGKTAEDPQNLSGTLQNNLPVNLQDAYLIYGHFYYPLNEALPGGEKGSPKVKVMVKGNQSEGINSTRRTTINSWASGNMPQNQQPWDMDGAANLHFFPGSLVLQYYFFDKSEAAGNVGNHMYRNLDQSWRIRENRAGDQMVRTATLVGKLARAEGRGGRLNGAGNPLVPSDLWIGTLPGGETKQPPALAGSLVQETYVRVFIPVRPVQP